VPLASAGPSREAYESGRPVLVRRTPWARRLEGRPRSKGDRIVGEGVVVDVTRPGRHQRVASRSIIWMPVRHGERTTALLSLQSYRADVFDDWHAHVLQDVAAYVGLALANAEHYRAAQAERQRLGGPPPARAGRVGRRRRGGDHPGDGGVPSARSSTRRSWCSPTSTRGGG